MKKWTLENIEVEILELKEMANKLEVNKGDIEQLATDLYKIEMRASVLREAVNKIQGSLRG